MRNARIAIPVLLAFAALPAAHASAQVNVTDSRPGNDRVSFGVVGGGFFSADELAPGTEFDNAGAVGGTITYWAHEYVGVRGNLLWSNPDVLGATGSPLAGENPNIWSYFGDLVLRLPLEATSQVSWFPYIAGGLGAKSYDFETLDMETDFSGSFGAGVELRFGENARWGINTEVRDYLSSFDRLGFDQTINDVIWTGGLTLNF